jgi:hypothetical protein
MHDLDTFEGWLKYQQLDLQGQPEETAPSQILGSDPEDRLRECVLVVESSEDGIGTHDIGLSATMRRRGRRECRDCRRIGNAGA